MNRDESLRRLADTEVWDVVVIGGGASGLGAAVEAASRGHRTLLLEQYDFAKCTSSRSTKLIHGGVRYLAQGQLGLVISALRERGTLERNAPHIIKRIPFVIPVYSRFDKLFYGFGLRLYDLLSGRLSFGRCRVLDRQATIARLPTVRTEGLVGGVLYMDGQFDDARLGVILAQTLEDIGGTPLNYARVEGFLRTEKRISGVAVVDLEHGTKFQVQARGILNAAGIFADRLRLLDDPAGSELLTLSQGSHLVVDRSFLPSEHALVIPRTADRRVLFAIPWLDHVLIGTTDVRAAEAQVEPGIRPEEIDFLLEQASAYLARRITRKDVLSAFSGQRPLVRKRGVKETARIPRDYTITVSSSGLVTIIGGKWTSYRKMGEDALDRLEAAAGLRKTKSRTRQLRLHGFAERCDESLSGRYGADGAAVESLIAADRHLAAPIHTALPFIRLADVVWAAQSEMARTLEDVLARRTRALYVNAKASMEAAPRVAELLAKVLGKDEAWTAAQVKEYSALASGYRLGR